MSRRVIPIVMFAVDNEKGNHCPMGHDTLLIFLHMHDVELHREAVAQKLVLASHVEMHLSRSVCDAVDLEGARRIVESQLNAVALVDFDGGIHGLLGVVGVEIAQTRIRDHDVGSDHHGRLLFTV